MPYFDFHCHPGLKPTFSDQKTAVSPWIFINAKLAIFKNAEISINPLFNEVLNSQSSLSQLYNGDVKLFGIALHAPESNMAKGLLEKKIVNKGAIPLLNRARLELIRDGNHYFEFLNDDLNRIIQSQAPAKLKGAKLKVITKSGDFDENDPKTIYAFLIVEGLHCFFNDQSAMNVKEIFTENFESFTDANTIFAINVCHIQQNSFCNHAYGIQFINSAYFFPKGNGITAWGREIINRMIEKKILVDIKHMSLFSRFQLYSMLRDADDQNKYVAPIICTHAGITGQSIQDRVKYLLRSPADVGIVYEVCYLKPKSPYIDNVYFNCSSLNLYNEDIEAILLSGGLIGLSFDQRILGFADENVLRDVTIPHDVEYISEQESTFFLGPSPSILPPWTDDTQVWTSDDFENLDPAFDTQLHPLFFLNHVIHILTVAKNNPAIGAKMATKHICLGSDYDGLINAIDNCKQADKLDTFKELFLNKMQGLLKNAGLDKEGIDVAEFAEDIFYTNGRDFILNRLKEIGK
jgi:microsomal dipeptidase-like Zn-dependent dipeptidase